MKHFLARLFERRSLENPRTPLSAPESWLWDSFGARTTVSGVSVTPENALEVTAVWAAVRRISSTLATLPLHVYRRTDAGREVAYDHPLYAILHDRPNPEQSSFVWRELQAAHLLLYGNAYAEIERDYSGRAIALWPLHPTAVRQTRVNDERVYVVRVDGQDVPLPSANVLHIQGFGLDGQQGLIPTSVARNAIGLSKATEAFGASFFGNGAAPSGVLTHPGKLGPEGSKNLRESWAKLHSGLSNAQRIAVLEEGVTWTPLGIPPEHAQFLETRKFTVEEVARIFLIPPHLIAALDRATFSNIEHQSVEYATHCIEPWTRRIEQELNHKLVGERSVYAEHSLDGLLRGDSKARSEFYASALQNGWMSVNEVRQRENLNRIAGGDQHFRPLNMTPLGQESSDDV